MKTALVSLLFVFSSSLHALSESNYHAEYNQEIVPLLAKFTHGTFDGTKNVKIHYARYASEQAGKRCLVILPGRTEPLEKYAEVVHSLDNGELKNEFVFYLMDHRGQGASGRMIEGTDNHDKGYVDDFDNYVNDIKIFLDTIIAKENCSQKYLLAHSLGAGISTAFLQKYPEYFERAALSSPMLKIITKPYSYAVAKSVVLANIAAGRKKKFAIGQKGFIGKREFEKNTFTSSPVRYEMAMSMFDKYPQTKLGGVTNGWVNEVMKGTRKVRRDYDSIRIPLRVFHAGIESYSEPSEMVRLCDEARYCVRTFLETSKHEVLMDRDINRNVVIKGLEEFFR